MLNYLLRRINLFVLTTLMLFAVVYAVTRALPGDLVSNLSGVRAPDIAQLAEISDTYRLEHGPIVGYVAYVNARLKGDFGVSMNSGEPIADQLLQVLPATLELGMLSIGLALLIGIPIGMLATLSRNTTVQRLVMTLTLVGFSLPVFWLGLLQIITFGIQFDWLPASGRINLMYEIPEFSGLLLVDIFLSDSPWRAAAMADAWAHLVLPMSVVMVLPLTIIVRITRFSLAEELDKNYIRALEARGVSRYTLIMNHALPNAMAPVLRVLALQLGPIASSIIIVELLFSWPGVGAWLVAALRQGDYTALQGGVLTISLFIVFLSILFDVVHTTLNPISRKEIYGQR
ncbi:ABC transporter permease subunit [Ferrimonas sediminicola]|uniref:ABC transporter permease subunit n=1 Tax=Ferrimonas sediminicola TaxID=2569538 RepID=A0A4U1B8E5_9GAMM|nr:ABC transporter permease subunit [Ferrimonas sediminicola]TKB46855.1 ABC transporter permease subunit [Ferrimonas sediminicola]